MSGLWRRATVFAVVLALGIVEAALPASASDSTAPTLQTFALTSPTTVGPGATVSLSYTATDDASGVSAVVFHFTDLLGTDHQTTGGSTGPATATVAADWPSGPYRLDYIDVTDGVGNRITYVAGGSTYLTPGTSGPSSHAFNLDAANFTVNNPSVPVPIKPPVRGLMDRSALPATSWQSTLNAYVIQARWADLQTSQGGAITSNNVVDQQIAQVRQLNAQKRTSQPHLSIKLRIRAGNDAPTWAQNLDGPPVSVHDTDGTTVITVGRFWTPNFAAAYADFQSKLAARYDLVPEVRDVVITRCTLGTAEPFLRNAGDTYTVNNLLAAGFNTTDDHSCHQQETDAHQVWAHTLSSTAFNPYTQINSDGSTPIDESWTESMIDYCRAQLGSRCVLGNNSIRDTSDPNLAQGPNYPPMYAKIASKGAPIYFQTAAPARLGSLCNTLGWALTQGAGAIELPGNYNSNSTYTQAGLSSYDKAFEGAQPPDTDTPSAPSNLTGSFSGPTTVNLAWSPATDSGYGVACYTVSRGGSAIGTTMATSFSDQAAGTTNSYLVTARDGAGHIGPAASADVPPSGPSVAPSPSTVNPGLSVTATWSGISSPTSQDWVAVFANSGTADTGTRVAWRFTNGAASGSLPVAIPTGTPAGTTYELRLFSNNSFVKLATSAPFSVAAPTLSASPSTVNPGLSVTATWSGISSPTSQDWVAVFANSGTADTGTRVAWRFTNGAASGSLPVAIPTGTPAGTTYELRLFSNNSFVKLATSAPFSVAAPTLSASPSTVNPGLSVTATWSGISSPTSQDWVAVFANSGTADTGTRVAWRFTNGAASGSLPVAIPTGTPAGTTYELRLFSNNSFVKLATSAPFSVAAPTLSASPSTVNPGLSVTATWSGISSPTSQDWVAVFANSGTADTGTRVASGYTTGAASGTVSIMLPPGTPAGTTYELRLFSSNSFVKLATSPPFTLAAPTLSASPSQVLRGSPVVAAWSGISSPTSQDWVAVFASSGTPDTGTRVAWRFTNGAASGSVSITIPADAPTGTTYEARLFSNNTFTKLATSAPFTVA